MPLPPNLTNWNPQPTQYQNPPWETDFFGASPENTMFFNKYNPAQENIFKYLLQQGYGMMNNPYAGFEDIANDATRQYNEQVLPSLMERFGEMTNAAPSSTAFSSQLAQSGGQFQQGLAAMKNQYGQQNRMNAMNMFGVGLQPQYETMFRARTPGFLESMLPGLMQAGGQAAGTIGKAAMFAAL